MHLIRNEALSSPSRARSKKRWESRVYACADHWHITAHEVWLPDA